MYDLRGNDTKLCYFQYSKENPVKPSQRATNLTGNKNKWPDITSHHIQAHSVELQSSQFMIQKGETLIEHAVLSVHPTLSLSGGGNQQLL